MRSWNGSSLIEEDRSCEYLLIALVNSVSAGKDRHIFRLLDRRHLCLAGYVRVSHCSDGDNGGRRRSAAAYLHFWDFDSSVCLFECAISALEHRDCLLWVCGLAEVNANPTKTAAIEEELNVLFAAVIAAIERFKIPIREHLVGTELLKAGDFGFGHAELPWW